MAGDWIKVEHATVDKPEVALLSELLGIPVPQGFGLLVIFWMWCDKHSRYGVVTQVSRMSIDTVTHTPGFAAALESVGWAQFDDAARTLTLPNFTRHNESSAKSRALSTERMKRKRYADSVTTASPEKRREEKIKEREITAPTEKHYELAKQFNVDADAQWPIYLDWNANAKRPHSDLSAGFSNWIRRRDEFARPTRPAGRQDARAAVLAGHFKDSHDGPRDITGEAKRVA